MHSNQTPSHVEQSSLGIWITKYIQTMKPGEGSKITPVQLCQISGQSGPPLVKRLKYLGQLGHFDCRSIGGRTVEVTG